MQRRENQIHCITKRVDFYKLYYSVEIVVKPYMRSAIAGYNVIMLLSNEYQFLCNMIPINTIMAQDIGCSKKSNCNFL
jgi:hypothetical protein